MRFACIVLDTSPFSDGIGSRIALIVRIISMFTSLFDGRGDVVELLKQGVDTRVDESSHRELIARPIEVGPVAGDEAV
jgi:hypothetical protein